MWCDRPGYRKSTEAPCRTNKQGRKPDVAYLTPELVEQFGEAAVFPQSFPFSVVVDELLA